MVMPLDAPQPHYSVPPLSEIPDDLEDQPEPGLSLNRVGALQLPTLVFGGASLSTQYNTEEHITSDNPLRTVRLALRYGISAFDTSAYYGPSEIILGAILERLEPEFPRSSYKLTTKCGRFGAHQDAFDYTPRAIRMSVERSLSRLHVKYLDAVYLHDVEYIADTVMPPSAGDRRSALDSDAEAYGLAEGQEGKVWGEGDQTVLNALAELRKMQAEGLVRHIGITGYPLPTLLRLALLALHTAPYKPLDVVLSYSQSNLQNTAFAAFAPAFRARAQVAQLVHASPFNMGLLTPHPPPWHPAPPALKAAAKRAIDACARAGWPGGLPNVAMGYAVRRTGEEAVGPDIPLVAGFSTPAEVHDAVRVWREVQDDVHRGERKEMEDIVLDILRETGYVGWAWDSPPDDLKSSA